MLRQRMTVDELELWIALASVDGPYWGYRDDVNAARIAQAALVCGGGKSPKLSDLIVEWGGGDEPVRMLPYADGVAAFMAMFGG